jgi:homoaconitate hydratase
MNGQTVVEKIANRHSVGLAPGQTVHAGDFVNIRPKHILTHDNTSAVMGKFKAITGDDGAVFNPRQPVFAIDHDIQNTSPENLAKYAKIQAFAEQQGVDFHPAGTGICHQVMVEQGYVIPGSMVVGSDSHSNLYGAAGALGTPVVRTDAACIWATGQTWWQVPPVARVMLEGKLQPGVVGKDVIIALCGVFNHDEVLNMVVEFGGDGVACLSMDQRMSVANMTTEWGALAGVFPFDDVLRDYLYGRADTLAAKTSPPYTRQDVDGWYTQRLEADAGANYAVELTLDLATVIPHVSGPDHVKVMRALPEIEKEKVKIHKAYLLSCVNARLEDLAEAARILDGEMVAEGVELYVAAASSEVQQQAEKLGHWKILQDAGAHMLPSGCGPCIGLGQGTLEQGEVCISATNRNFKGRMGARDAQAYLASPAVVAASAMAGFICAPGGDGRDHRRLPGPSHRTGPAAADRQPQHRRHLLRQAHLPRRRHAPGDGGGVLRQLRPEVQRRGRRGGHRRGGAELRVGLVAGAGRDLPRSPGPAVRDRGVLQPDLQAKCLQQRVLGPRQPRALRRAAREAGRPGRADDHRPRDHHRFHELAHPARRSGAILLAPEQRRPGADRRRRRREHRSKPTQQGIE